jgi:hypothetical protein
MRDAAGNERPSERPSGLTPEQEQAAWAKHNRESILEDREFTAAERFEWLEQMQATFAELHPELAAENRPHR